jgi:hypothetical protein
MYRKLIYLLSLVLLMSIPTRRANASHPYLQDSGPDGIVSMEAEKYDANVPQRSQTWTLVTSPAGASGYKAMQAQPNSGTKRRDPYGDDGYLTSSPRLDFKVSFVRTGTHYVWIRGHANGSGNDDDCHAGLDYQPVTTGEQINFNAAVDWGWFNASKKIAGPATLWIPSAGVHTVNIWMCDDGAIIDKIVLMTNLSYQPSGEGPEESARANYLVVDDFENYDDTNKIFETWIDGLVNGTGSVIGHSNSPYVEQTIVHGGSKSMPYYYDNNRAGKAHYSEAEADTAKLEIGPDWTKEGIKALTLYFYGNPNNAANVTERMYAALKDNDSMAVVYYDGNPNDVREQKWHQWDIKLTDFTNIDLNNVKKVYIGFGNRDHPASGGSGLVYFDDIRLYPSRCVPGHAKPAGDFNDDCVVDYADLETMTDGWLNDYQFEDFARLADNWLEEILWP